MNARLRLTGRGSVGLAGALIGVLVALVASGCGMAVPHPPHTATAITLAVRYSRFETGLVTVPAGVPITFTVRNDDPIEHEWIVGPAHVHAAHRTGTEAQHDARPDEVTLPPYATRTTTLTFDAPGDYLFICHLPGHEAYGMSGIVRVRSS